MRSSKSAKDSTESFVRELSPRPLREPGEVEPWLAEAVLLIDSHAMACSAGYRCYFEQTCQRQLHLSR